MDIFPPPGGVYIDPLLLPDIPLFNTGVSLMLTCGKNKFPMRERHREYVCFGAQLFKLEMDRRGITAPGLPIGVGSYKPDHHH
jgi:hypothetical protein